MTALFKARRVRLRSGDGDGGAPRPVDLPQAGRPSIAAAGSDACVDATGPAEAECGLRLLGLSHRYERHEVLRGVSLSVGRGEIVCVLGPSGCGKTTLLRLAAGLERLQEGRIEIGDNAVADAAAGLAVPPERRRVGLMFQDYALFPHITVADNIRFGTAGTAADEAWVTAAMARAGLNPWARAYPHTLSGGQQQRCALLRALAPHPAVLLLDEPFSGLDVVLRAQVREETAAFLRETRIPTLVVTHDPEEAMVLADRLVIMRVGAVVQDGTPADIYQCPVDPFAAAVFGPLNQWRGSVRQGRVETPIGAFASPHIAEGSAAVVLIRPEGIVIDANASGAAVVDSRLLGATTALTLVTDAGAWRLRASLPGVYLPAVGTPVGIRVDARACFVFPANASSDDSLDAMTPAQSAAAPAFA